jgi:hypothetical protein
MWILHATNRQVKGANMISSPFGLGDTVRVDGENGIWTITCHRSAGEPHFEIQLGKDAFTKRYVSTDKLALVQKAKKPDVGPGFYPANSIMG